MDTSAIVFTPKTQGSWQKLGNTDYKSHKIRKFSVRMCLLRTIEAIPKMSENMTA